MAPYHIKNKQWKEFFIGGENGIFNITSSSSGIDKNKLITATDYKERHIPYITRSEVTNGINLFVSDNQAEKYSLDEGGVITIGLDTQTVFYQPHDFYAGQNIQVLRQKNLNERTAQFIIPLLKVQMEKFNWGGNGATLGRLFRTKIMLPVTKSQEPDWQFMEEYIQSILDQKTAKYKKYCGDVLKSIECKNIPSLHEKKWDEFFIQDIADILPGRDIYERERVTGRTPYISSTAKNNGIQYFVNNTNKTLARDCLSVNRNGSVGYSFFHPYYCLYSNDCRKLKLKHHSKYCGFFISNQITRQRHKYNYGYKMGTARLKRQKIMLPVNTINEPDYEYMEQYMKNIEYKKRTKYLDYLENKYTAYQS